MWPPAPALFRILVITWITARKYAHTLISATTLKMYHDSTYKLIDSVASTCHVASSSQLRSKTYLALLPRVALGTSVVYSLIFVVQSLIFSVSCKFSVSRTSVNSRTYKLMTSHTITASSYNNHTLATTLKMCHVSNSLILDTVTLTCYAALLPPLNLNVYPAMSSLIRNVTLNTILSTLSASCTPYKLGTCITSFLFTVIACINILWGSNILIANVLYSCNP
jgi:hypothetical protein